MRSIVQSIGQVEVSSLPGLLARRIACGFVIGCHKPKTPDKRNSCLCSGRIGCANHVLVSQLIVAVTPDKKLFPIPLRGGFPVYCHPNISLCQSSSVCPLAAMAARHFGSSHLRALGPLTYR